LLECPARRRSPRGRKQEEEILTDAGAGSGLSGGQESAVTGVDRREGATVVSLAGELDLYNAEEVRSALLEAVAEEPETLVVGLPEVTFIDSTALGVLVDIHRRMGGRENFHLAEPGLEVRRALEVSGLDRHFSVHDTVADALDARQ
jgi:anti-anti-sigma factor